MELTLSGAIAEYIEQRKQTKLEPLQKARDKILNSTDDVVMLAQAKADYAENAAPIEATFKPNVWITDAAKRAKQISLATHAAKFTHSDAKASSVLVSEFNIENDAYLTTASLPNKAIDAVGNAAALDVVKLLKITINGESLITQLQHNHVEALVIFSQDQAQLKQWQSGFKLGLGELDVSAHTLTKQLYFPIGDIQPVQTEDQVEQYHLLCPLFSSSMAHEMHRQVTSTRFGESKEIRDARRKGHYHGELEQSFPATAVQNFGGSKPQNISQLNSERYGQSFLLNCAPPRYQAQTKPPLTSTSFFNRQLSYKSAGLLREFKTSLEGLTEQESNFNTRYQRDYHYVRPIIDTVLNHAAMIQSLSDHAGWANNEKCVLKAEHGLWLDINNLNSKFQTEREKGEWLLVVMQDFSRWLTYQLKSKDGYVLGDVEQNYFSKLFLKELKRFERGISTAEKA
ncbi:MAG: type I-F CRISPR-associated protein Csy1 [Vibrio hibernica]